VHLRQQSTGLEALEDAEGERRAADAAAGNREAHDAVGAGAGRDDLALLLVYVLPE
jgi:hypothetical protein